MATALATTSVDRKKIVGGSDMAAILGLSPWKTPYQLWREKVGLDDDIPDPARAKIMRRGQLLEPVIVQLAKEEYGIEVSARNQRFYDDDLPFLSCEIDLEWTDIDGSTQNADAKSVNPFSADGWGKEQGDDSIPLYYTVQFLHGLGITGRQRTVCLTLIGTDDLRVYRVERDDQMIAFMRKKAAEFWDMVQSHTAPPVSTLEDAKIVWPKDNGQVIVATPEIAEVARQHRELKDLLKQAKQRCEAMELEIQKYMQDHTELVGPDGKRLATWKRQERRGYTVDPCSFRVFRA